MLPVKIMLDVDQDVELPAKILFSNTMCDKSWDLWNLLSRILKKQAQTFERLATRFVHIIYPYLYMGMITTIRENYSMAILEDPTLTILVVSLRLLCYEYNLSTIP